MKRILFLCACIALLVGCTPEGTISGYPQSKLNQMLVDRNLEEDGYYGTVQFYIPPKEKITEKLPMVIYFSDVQGDDGVNSIIEYIDKEDNPAIVVIVPHQTDQHLRARVSQGVEDYILSKIKDRDSAIDGKRIYVTGFGAGGMEAWNFAMENAAWVTTVAPVCSGPPSGKKYDDPEPPIIMTEMNIWAVQYVDDPTVNNDYSKKIVTALWTQDLSTCRFSEFFEGGHTTAPFKQRAFLDWMFGTRRLPESTGVN